MEENKTLESIKGGESYRGGIRTSMPPLFKTKGLADNPSYAYCRNSISFFILPSATCLIEEMNIIMYKETATYLTLDGIIWHTLNATRKLSVKYKIERSDEMGSLRLMFYYEESIERPTEAIFLNPCNLCECFT
ncbi:hypothetical protein MKW98_002863 [Papaver atlanticum]|uniref:Uncharacterized protein n=1 Tax=Papaver atlanticum TaxID=357466 RepID=A0AAD4SWI3_9MAGN|nr:hypothetical protein MKW98_002863 [Papaver atlanticum]